MSRTEEHFFDPAPPDVAARASREISASVSSPSREEWTALLEKAGLQDIQVTIQTIDVKDEARGILRRCGFSGMLPVMGRMPRLYFRNPHDRRFVKSIQQEGITPENLTDYFGYGNYVGRKGAS